MPKKWKLQQVLVYSLAVIVWVNNFQTSDSNSFFCDSNDIARSSNMSGGWGVGLQNKDNWKPEVQLGGLPDLCCAHSTPNWR